MPLRGEGAMRLTRRQVLHAVGPALSSARGPLTIIVRTAPNQTCDPEDEDTASTPPAYRKQILRAASNKLTA